MSPIVLDANAIIAHGRAFPERARAAFDRGETLVVPHSVKRELVDDVLANEAAPPNHRASARSTEELVDEGYLRVQKPDFEAYSDVIDEARRRIADESLPEHAVKADQYIPAIVCELAQKEHVRLVTADQKLGGTVLAIGEKHELVDTISIHHPSSVL
jgi:rRNA maturation endonuclease Nob1